MDLPSLTHEHDCPWLSRPINLSCLVGLFLQRGLTNVTKTWCISYTIILGRRMRTWAASSSTWTALMSRPTRWVKGISLSVSWGMDGAWWAGAVFEDVREKPGEHQAACCVM